MTARAEVVVALGTNLGNRCRNLSAGLKKMRQLGVEVLRHSCLYETAPVGLLDQPDFLNAAVLATTQDPPLTLLQKLKQIEADLGRDFEAPRFGPRPMDFDIIFYGNQDAWSDPELWPRLRWKERDFVKIPLKDLAKSYFSVRSSCQEQVKARLDAAVELPIGEERDHLKVVFDMGKDRVEQFGVSTWMMHILNITPDSFSDGGRLLSGPDGLKEGAVLDAARKALAHGARIIDIGGQSTRPGSSPVSPDVELSRILPVIKLLRAELGDQCPYLSVDTFYASVAREAVAAGADMINDISGGTRDPDALKTVLPAFWVAELEVPVVLMHMRGTPQTMTHVENLSYSSDPIKDVGKELQRISEKAMMSGIPPWQQILDPGIGFAKTADTSFKILLDLHRLKGGILKGSCAKMPLCVGFSRKRFLSAFTGDKEARERDVVSCALAMDAVRNGADILRVHNSEMTHEVLSLADAVYRTRQLP